jgi:RsiW-degrading membrane proteinase PrsW (M82 family)
MKPYYFTLDGKSAVGPTSLAQIESDIKAGLLPADTKISDERLAEWFTLEDWLEHEKSAPEDVATQSDTAQKGASIYDGQTRALGGMADRITQFAGMDRIQGFRLRAFFSEVFHLKSDDEVEARLSVGSLDNTPPVSAVSCEWPRPWVFARVLALVLAMYFIFLQAWSHFLNPNLIPAILITGSFAVPMSVLVLFLEVNQWKNISLYQTMKWFAAGGVVSLVITLFLFDFLETEKLEWLGASIAGPIEETAKVVAAALIARKARHKRILNGLVVGAAVGAGFAAFESAGYALRHFGAGLVRGFLSMETAVNTMVELITARGVLAPLCHIPWTAATTAALWMVMNGEAFQWRMMLRGRFIRILIMMTILHMTWNAEFASQTPFFAKYIVLGIIAWVVNFSFVQAGLREILQVQREATSGANS